MEEEEEEEERESNNPLLPSYPTPSLYLDVPGMTSLQVPLVHATDGCTTKGHSKTIQVQPISNPAAPPTFISQSVCSYLRL